MRGQAYIEYAPWRYVIDSRPARLTLAGRRPRSDDIKALLLAAGIHDVQPHRIASGVRPCH